MKKRVEYEQLLMKAYELLGMGCETVEEEEWLERFKERVCQVIDLFYEEEK